MFCYHTTSKFVVLAYFAVLIGLAVPLHALVGAQSEQAPVAKTKPFQHKYHGEVIDDPYQWIKDEGQYSTDVKEYLDAEKVYAQQVLAKDQQLKDQIRNEMVKVIGRSPTESSQYIGNYRYYSKRQPGAKSSVYYRKKIDVPNAPEEIVLDPSTLPEGSRDVFDVKPNSDHTIVGFKVYDSINRKSSLQFNDLASGKLLPDKVENIGYWAEWSGTGKSTLYATKDSDGVRLMRHTIGTPVDKDSAIHTGQKGSYISVKKSSSNRYFFICISKANVEPQYFYLDATSDTASKMAPIPVTLSTESYLQVYHLNKQFLLVITSGDTMKKTAYVCDIDKINDKSAHKRVLENAKLEISDIAVFRNHIVLFNDVAVTQQVTVYDYDSEGRLQPSAKSHNIEFPAKSYRATYKGVADYNSDTLIFEYSSLITPRTTYSYNMATKKATKTYVDPVPDYNESDYVTELIYAKGKPDSKGNQPDIPITIAYKRGLKKNGANPAWVVGNGGGTPMLEVDFRAEFVSLLNRGFVCAIAHSRRTEDPELTGDDIATVHNNNQAFIDDFMAATNALVSEKYTSHNLMVVEGYNDGSTIIGAAINKQPDIAKVAIISMPYLNVLDAMMEQSTDSEYVGIPEWGNPAKSIDDYKAIRSYSPYENIKSNAIYPNILLINYSDDTFAPYRDAAKWVAKLRAATAQSAKNSTNPHTIVMLEHDDKEQDDSYLGQNAAKLSYALNKLGKAVKPLNSA
ncbi:prolyl oligopeptidase [Syncephalis plumigaleata]|nr:prolyl oligopeptidase [Syncephalis plumigaleata]